MAACTQCGAKLLDDVRFCTQCGADQLGSYSEAPTFVPTADNPKPGDRSASDTATIPVVAEPPTRPFDPLSEFAGPDPHMSEAEPAFYEPPPPRAPSPSPPTKEYDLRPKPPPVDLPTSPAAPSYSPPPFPPPPLVTPLPDVPAAPISPAAQVPAGPRPKIVFPPASDRHSFSQTTRNLVYMGLLVWGFAGFAYAAYLGWSTWSPATVADSAAVSDSAFPPAAAPDTASPVSSVPPARASQSVFTGHTAAVTTLSVSSDQQQVMSGGGQGDCSVRIWDLSRGSQSGRFDGHGQDCAVLVAAFTGAGRAASAAGPTDFALRVWDPASGGELRQLSGGEGLIFRAVAPDGTRAIGQELGGPDGGGGFSLWNLETGARLTTVSARGLAASFAFSATGDRILTGGDSGQLAVWDAGTGQQLQVFPGHGVGVAVSSVAFAPNRRLLVSAGADERVVLWDPETGAAFRSVAGATTFAMADNSRTLALGGPDGVVRVVDAITGAERARFTGHQGAVQALAWVQGGRTLISGGADKTVRVWSVDPRP